MQGDGGRGGSLRGGTGAAVIDAVFGGGPCCGAESLANRGSLVPPCDGQSVEVVAARQHGERVGLCEIFRRPWPSSAHQRPESTR